MKKKYILLSVFLFTLFVGIWLLLYPIYRTRVENEEEARKAEGFRRYVAAANENPSEIPETCQSAAFSEKPFPSLWKACEAYNVQLYEQRQRNLDNLTMQSAGVCLPDYGYEQDIFCCLSFPKQDFEIPVYLGANSHNLDRGAAVLGQTSLPIGGESTNCVIAGHRCWNAAVKFRAIESLKKGDRVLLTNPWETLEYRVIETKVVQPSALKPVSIQEGRDLLTLFTCTLGSGQRYLVICEREVN